MKKKGILTLSNVTQDLNFSIQGVALTPAKGRVISMELGNPTDQLWHGTNNHYRIVSLNGTIAEVVAQYAYNAYTPTPPTRSMTFWNSSGTNWYTGSDVDNLNNVTFYNALNDVAKAAIVDKNLVQYQYREDTMYYKSTHHSDANYSAKYTKATPGDRHVYLLDIEDIEIYFNHKFTATDLHQFFWNCNSGLETIYVPLRSAVYGDTDYVWAFDGDYGISSYWVKSPMYNHPALTIDLSKIDYTIVG